MPRARILGYIACIFSLAAGILFFYYGFFNSGITNFNNIDSISLSTYYAISIPTGIAALAVLGSGFWIGWTILTIKVVPPMPDIVENKDYAKLKAFFLCLITVGLGALFIYGIYLKSFWALAVPSAIITLVMLGMIFWVGMAIITTRKTLPDKSE